MPRKNALLMVGIVFLVIGIVTFSSSHILAIVLIVAAIAAFIGSVSIGSRDSRAGNR